MSTTTFPTTNRPVDVRVVDDVAAAASTLLLDLVHGGAQLHVALAGGSTPQAAYVLAGDAGADWSGTTLWVSDERVVPLDDERSNAGAAQRALAEGVVPKAWQLVDTAREPADAAADYASRMQAEVPLNNAGVPVFDLVLLGIGPDGHCASLFPGTASVTETELLVTHVDTPGLEPIVPRVTFTLPLLTAATRVVFLVSGASKVGAVRAAFVDEPTPATPSSLVAPTPGTLELVIDPDAVPAAG